MLPESEFRKFPAQNGTKFSVTIPADVLAGTVEVRAAGFFGLSTARPFVIAAKDTPIVPKSGDGTLEKAPELPREGVGYGQMAANGIDLWKFTAKKGERVLIKCLSEYLDSKADATLIVYNGAKKELERSRDSRGLDPMIDFTVPADGTFWIGVHDYTYLGGATHSYTVTVTSKPHIDFAFPPSVEPGKKARVTLFGRNLPGGSQGSGAEIDGKPLETLEVDITAPADRSAIPVFFSQGRPSHGLLPGFEFSKDGSNSIRICFARGTVTPENPAEEAAQAITLPVEVVGRFDSRTDEDRFRFAGKKDTKYWIEAISDRLASRTDPFVIVEKITKADDGTETLKAVGSDDDETGHGGTAFDTLTRDSFVSFTADADSEYQVTILNQFARGGSEKIYRLVIREAQPDFQLLAIPERSVIAARQFATVAPLLRKNGNAAVRVVVNRQDGFDQPVTLTAEGLPAGVTAAPVVVDPAAEVSYLVFSAGPEAKAWHGQVSIVGKAGNETRTARVGSIPWPVANNTTERVRARLDQTFALAVTEDEIEPVTAELADPAKPLVAEMDGTLDIPVKITHHTDKKVKGNVTVQAWGLNGLIKPPVINIAEGKTDGVLKLTFKKQANVFSPEVGKFSFVLRANGNVNYQHNLPASKRAEEEKTHVIELVKKITADAAKAKTDAAAAKVAFDAATKNLAAASPEAKPALEKALAEAKAKNDAAQKLNIDLAAKLKKGQAEQKAADARAKAATDKAKEKATPFAIYSKPVTIEIKPKPEPEPKK
ncbi:MAG: hypothetical protein HKN23_10850 [Verrucomicrobiales bacterium]|nr:hypothetical protein [Verrucomicrobiales bacterium]